MPLRNPYTFVQSTIEVVFDSVNCLNCLVPNCTFFLCLGSDIRYNGCYCLFLMHTQYSVLRIVPIHTKDLSSAVEDPESENVQTEIYIMDYISDYWRRKEDYNNIQRIREVHKYGRTGIAGGRILTFTNA